MLGQSQVGVRGAGAWGRDLPSGTSCSSSAFSSGLFWAVPLLDRLGVLRVPGPHPSCASSLKPPVWMQSHTDPTFLAVVPPLITPSPCTGRVASRSPVCTGRPAPQAHTSFQGCVSRKALTWPAAGKLDELTLRKECYCLRLLPCSASTALQMLAGIRGLATACTTVYRHQGKESQRGALDYRKPHRLLLLQAYRDVGCGLWGHLSLPARSLLAQVVFTVPPWPLPLSQAPSYV